MRIAQIIGRFCTESVSIFRMKEVLFLNLCLGMTCKEVRAHFDKNDITDEQDMKNGFFWIRGWYPLFSERTYVGLCFQDGRLWMINIYPHFSEDAEGKPFRISENGRMICEKWVEEHKEHLPANAKVYYDIRMPEVCICIR